MVPLKPKASLNLNLNFNLNFNLKPAGRVAHHMLHSNPFHGTPKT